MFLSSTQLYLLTMRDLAPPRFDEGWARDAPSTAPAQGGVPTGAGAKAAGDVAKAARPAPGGLRRHRGSAPAKTRPGAWSARRGA